MWARKQIDISYRQILHGMLGCLSFSDRADLTKKIVNDFGGQNALVCLSVRSGFDLLLRATAWLPSSEIIMTGLTIHDMERIVSEHGFVPVGVDISTSTLEPSIESIEELITPRTKAIVVSHLFGGVLKLEPILQLARKFGIMVIEDCAQAYVGNEYTGDPRADVSMFSFGPIKTNTALGGGVLLVRREKLKQTMLRIQNRWPAQSRGAFLKRCLKYTAVKSASTRFGTSLFFRTCRLLRINHDAIASQLARGFSGAEFFLQIRQRPSIPLLKLLRKRISHFEGATIHARRNTGARIVNSLRNNVEVIGSNVQNPSHWVLLVRLNDPTDSDRILGRLWNAGFDATQLSSLRSIGHHCPNIDAALQHSIFLPVNPKMTERAINRMVEVLNSKILDRADFRQTTRKNLVRARRFNEL